MITFWGGTKKCITDISLFGSKIGPQKVQNLSEKPTFGGPKQGSFLGQKGGQKWYFGLFLIDGRNYMSSVKKCSKPVLQKGCFWTLFWVQKEVTFGVKFWVQKGVILDPQTSVFRTSIGISDPRKKCSKRGAFWVPKRDPKKVQKWLRVKNAQLGGAWVPVYIQTPPLDISLAAQAQIPGVMTS